MDIIKVSDLSKVYKIPKRREGFLNSFKDLIKKEWNYKTALNDIDLTIKEGEIVGYIGPNGAGKSTTIKIMSGVLYPSSGKVVVNGLEPYKHKRENARSISLIAGQRTKLYWDLPIADTFELMKRVYKIPEHKYKKNLDILCEVIDIKDLLDIPARQLSLGQRMRADFVAAMLHEPSIIYLDEPTIGLDVVAKEHIRRFIRTINEEKNTTIIITSHDIADIERICKRVIVIDKGSIIYSGDIENLKRQSHLNESILNVKIANEGKCLNLNNYKVENNEDMYSIYFDRSILTPSQMIYELIEKGYEIIDFSLTEPCLEDAIKKIYSRSVNE